MKSAAVRFGPYVLFVALSASAADKALHIDDTLFVAWARHLVERPTEPLAHTVKWMGVERPMVEFSPNPPGQAYLLAAVMGPTGSEAEWLLHLWLLPFGWLGLWATGALARRFGAPADAARWLAASSPVLVLSAQSLMPDLAVFGLATASVALALRAVDDDAGRASVLAGLLMGAAILFRYNAAVLLALPPLYAVLVRRGRWRAAMTVAAAGGVVSLWVASVVLGGLGAHFGSAWAQGDERGLGALAMNLLCSVTLLGAVLVAPPCLLLAPRGRWARVAMIAAVIVAFIVLRAYAHEGLFGDSLVPWLMPPLLVGGLVALLVALRAVVSGLRRGRARTREESGELLLALWFLGFLALPVLYIHVAAKYLLPLLAPALVLLLRWRGPLGRVALVVVVAVGCASSLALGFADRELAGVAPRVAREVAAPLVRARPVWFTAEWGMQHYLARAGARSLHPGVRPAVGDYVLTTSNAPPPPAELLRTLGVRTRLVRRVAYPAEWPVLTMNRRAHAGYYSNHWGWLPAAPARAGALVEEVEVLEIEAVAPPSAP